MHVCGDILDINFQIAISVYKINDELNFDVLMLIFVDVQKETLARLMRAVSEVCEVGSTSLLLRRIK